jgi:hypothetical protein
LDDSHSPPVQAGQRVDAVEIATFAFENLAGPEVDDFTHEIPLVCEVLVEL